MEFEAYLLTSQSPVVGAHPYSEHANLHLFLNFENYVVTITHQKNIYVFSYYSIL